MKIQIKNSELLRALGHVQSIVEKRTTKNILSNVKISTKKRQVFFYTTDLDIFAKEVVEASVGGEVTTTIPIHILYDIVRKIEPKEDIQFIFEPSDNPLKLLVKACSSEFVLPCLSAEYFPDFEEGNHDCEFNISSNDLSYLISTTKHAISYDDTRYYLNGVFFHAVEDNGVKILRTVATDVHRLAVAEVTLPKNASLMPEIIIPKKMIFELIKIIEDHKGDVFMGISSKKITIKAGAVTIISKLIDGKFPDYNKAIPHGNTKLLKVPIKALAKAIDLVTAISTEKVKVAKLNMKKDKLILSVSDKINSSGIIDIPANYNDEEISVAFNSRYMLDILNNLTGDTACFKINSMDTAVLVEDNANSNCRFVLMPIQM
jgi:DNA polymerase-3 subunit beta